jgi:hypothetical protein
MNRRLTFTVVSVTAMASLALGGSLSAWASWTTGGDTGRTSVVAADIPRMSRPGAELSDGSPKIAWTELKGLRGVRYVVLRSGGDTRSAVACTVNAPARSCRDTKAKPGTKASYTVHAEIGTRWAGRPSEPSAVVTIPAGAAPKGDVPQDQATDALVAETTAPATPSADSSPETAPRAVEAPLPSQTTPTTSAPEPVEPSPASPAGADDGAGASETTVGAPAEAEEVPAGK